jgi:peptidoglycan/xylan/chitin deacetylase (PgdA/CDA1 family)
MKRIFFATGTVLILLAGCTSNGNPINKNVAVTDSARADSSNSVTSTHPTGPVADAATILARTQVPVLCYHHIREFRPTDGENMKSYSVTPANFAAQMKMLADSGYHTVLPDQLYSYLAYGTPLPEKPVMLTYDDTDLEQYTLGAAEMKKYGFKGVFFIMTISMNRPRYMSKEQIKELSDDGHVIACHTWDHHMVTKYTATDWDLQLVKPRKQLEEITGKPVSYFAYPFGLWNQAAIPELQKRDYKLSFILSTKRDSIQPLQTVRRMIVPGQWSAAGMLRSMRSTFHY